MQRTHLTWRERTVLFIMLTVARFLSTDAKLREDIQNIANAIHVRGAEPIEDAEEVLH